MSDHSASAGAVTSVRRRFPAVPGPVRGWLPGVPAGLLLLIISVRSLAAPSLWLDEAVSAEVALGPISGVWRFVTTVEGNMTGYYFLLHLWAKLGDGDVWLRLPSLLAAALTLVVMGHLVRRITGSAWLAVLATVPIAFFPDYRWHAVDARGYMFAALFVALAIATVLDTRDGATGLRIRPLLTGICLGLASLFALTSLLVIPVLTFVVLLFGNPRAGGRRGNLLRLIGAVGIVLLCQAPFLSVYGKAYGGQARWIQEVPITHWVGIASDMAAPLDAVLLLSAGLLTVTGFMALRGTRWFRGLRLPAEPCAIVLWGMLAFGPLLLLGIVSAVTRPLMIPRAVFFSVPFLVAAPVLLLAPWWQEAGRRTLVRAGCVAAAITLAGLWLAPPFQSRPMTDEFGPAVAEALAAADPSDVFGSYGFSRVAAKYGLPIDTAPTADTSHLWLVDFGLHPTSVERAHIDVVAARMGLRASGEPVVEAQFGLIQVTSVAVEPKR
jgi:mannosyltransferase